MAIVLVQRTVFAMFLLLPSFASASRPQLDVRVTPRFALAPADVLIRVVIDPDDDNRQIEVAIESLLYYRSSMIDLEGARAPRVNELWFRQLRAGDYELRVLLLDAGGHQRAFVRRFVSLS